MAAARSLGADYPLRLVCQLLGVARSSVLYRKKPQRNLKRLSGLIQANLVTFRTAGFTWMYKLLRRQGVVCSRSEVRRVYADLNLLRKRPPRRFRTTDSRHEHERYPNLVRDLAAQRPDHIWAADTLELRIQMRKAFLALIEDIFTRRVMGFALSFANDSLLTLQALEKALLIGTPEIHHSDQGKTYASDLYTSKLLGVHVLISMAAVGKAWENGFAERLNRTFREQEIALSEYQSLEEAIESIGNYAKLYNEQRMHQGLGYLTPREVKEAYDQRPENGASNPQ